VVYLYLFTKEIFELISIWFVAGSAFQSKGDDFYNTIFYFSGMGSVIGSALSQGVYVSEQNRRNAIDPDDVSGKLKGIDILT